MQIYLPGRGPGQHNFWRGDHVSVYDKGTREQLKKLEGSIDIDRAIEVWEAACATKWDKDHVWTHGDLAIGNLLVNRGRLSAVIDFGGPCIGDPACDLGILSGALERFS